MSKGKAKGRTLSFSFDGTGNEPLDANRFEHDESVSNVLKLHILMGGGLDEDKTNTTTKSGRQQVTRYYNGIGTLREGETIPLVGGLIAKATGFFNEALAPSFGDARTILNHADRELTELDPSARDDIVVFGFSRGAALARKFASTVLKNHPKLKISFLGLFDTVAAMDGIHRAGEVISSDVVFENGTLDERVKRAVHIVSLDENRIAFEPTLINRDEENPDRITEIWFPGVHSDIGGGYWHDGLADVSLSFMIDQCKAALGGRIKITNPEDADRIEKILASQGEILKMLDVDDIIAHPNVTGMVHHHTEGVGKVYPKEPRKVCTMKDDRPVPTSKYRPLVHQSVKARFDLVAEYRPPALRGVDFALMYDDGERIEVSGIAGLRKHPDSRSREEKQRG